MIWLENIDVIGTTAYVQKEKEKVTDILYLHFHFRQRDDPIKTEYIID